jgi:hypothetical protein
MGTPDEIRRDLPPDLDPAEREQLVALALRLEADAPVPAPTFRGDLRRRLMGMAGRRVRGRAAPRPIRALAAAYAVSGTLLLAVAALGLASAGPFAPG